MKGNGNVQPDIPPVALDDEAKKKLGLMEDAFAGIAKRREDLDLIAPCTIPIIKKIEIGNNPAKTDEYMKIVRNQAMAMIGHAVMDTLIRSPQSRLIPVPYTVRSIRHDLDLRVAFWELNPASSDSEIKEIEGKWALGMRFLARTPGS